MCVCFRGHCYLLCIYTQDQTFYIKYLYLKLPEERQKKSSNDARSSQDRQTLAKRSLAD